MIGLALLRCVTSWWPRSAAERLAEVFVSVDAGRDAVLESSFSALGDDSFDLAEAGVDLGDPVLLFPGAVVDDDAVKCASADSAAGVGPTAVPLDPPSGQPNTHAEWRLTAAEMDLLDVKPGDYIGDAVVGEPIERVPPLSPDDLEKASAVIRRVANGWPVFGDESRELLALAERLFAASYPQIGH